MIFAELIFDGHYNDKHDEVEAILRRRFASVESGLQSDSHFTIREDGLTVRVDTFNSMRHEVKSRTVNPLVDRVTSALESRFKLARFDTPKYEPFEPEYD